MAETWLLSNVSEGACGPGGRLALAAAILAAAQNLTLDLTGDTWSHTITPGVPSQIHEAGTVLATLFLRKTGLGNGVVNVEVERWDSGCNRQETLVNVNQTVTTGAYTAYNFANVITQKVAWLPDDLLMCIVRLVSGGPIALQYNQSGPTPSRVILPDLQIGRPWYVYANS